MSREGGDREVPEGLSGAAVAGSDSAVPNVELPDSPKKPSPEVKDEHVVPGSPTKAPEESSVQKVAPKNRDARTPGN